MSRLATLGILVVLVSPWVACTKNTGQTLPDERAASEFEPGPTPDPTRVPMSADEDLEAILATLASGTSPSTAEMLAYRSKPRAIARLAEALPKQHATARMWGVRLIADLGRPMIPAAPPVPERPGPIVVDPDAVAYLVDSLGDDDKAVRAAAAKTLCRWVPRDLAATHAATIIAHLRRAPSTDSAAALLGRTGSSEALAWLRSDPSFASTSPDDAEVARAALGETSAEQAILAKLPPETEPSQRITLLGRIGAIGSEPAVRVLAAELRTPAIFVAPDGSRVSMRVKVIEALHAARLREKVFWPPFLPPQDDTYYEAIEAWLTDHLGTRWSQARPPFLYREVVPTPAPPPPTPR